MFSLRLTVIALLAVGCGPQDAPSDAGVGGQVDHSPGGHGGQGGGTEVPGTAGQSFGGMPGIPTTGGTSSGGSSAGGSGFGGSGAGGAAGGSGGSSGGGTDPDVMPETEGFVFFVDNCEACHGLTGAGEAKDQGGPNVAHPDRELARWVIRNGRLRPDYVQNMRAHLPAELPDPVLEEILDYLESVPKPTTPEGLYLDYCANCHGEDAKGGLSKKDITLADEAKLLAMARLGRNPTLVSERERYMPVFTPEKLSDQELAAIVGYITGL